MNILQIIISPVLMGIILFPETPHFLNNSGNQITMDSCIYYDGNNNQYTINTTGIMYKPVQPEQSSSGIYSGGEPYQVSFKHGDKDKLWAAIEKAVRLTSGQTKTRMMGTAMLLIYPGKETYIFESGSQQKRDIEALLSEITDQ